MMKEFFFRSEMRRFQKNRFRSPSRLALLLFFVSFHISICLEGATPPSPLREVLKGIGAEPLAPPIMENFSIQERAKMSAIASALLGRSAQAEIHLESLIGDQPSRELLCRFVTGYVYASEKPGVSTRLRLSFQTAPTRDDPLSESRRQIQELFRRCAEWSAEGGEKGPPWPNDEVVLEWGRERVTLQPVAKAVREEAGREIAGIAERTEKLPPNLLLAGMREGVAGRKVADSLSRGVAAPVTSLGEAIGQAVKESLVAYARASQNAVFIGVKVKF
ncbi:MAG: hypothetical protein HY391_05960 [Deltaproteobacteria bacterium]|nr:hypothetical protein [Deltaproteobacteria bacterium]